MSNVGQVRLTHGLANADCAVYLQKVAQIVINFLGNMWATLGPQPHLPVLTVPYFCQNWPRYILTRAIFTIYHMGHGSHSDYTLL